MSGPHSFKGLLAFSWFGSQAGIRFRVRVADVHLIVMFKLFRVKTISAFITIKRPVCCVSHQQQVHGKSGATGSGSGFGVIAE